MKEWRRPSLRRVIVLILIERNGEGGIHSYLGTFLFERRLRQILRTLEEQHEVTQKGWGLTKRHLMRPRLMTTLKRYFVS